MCPCSTVFLDDNSGKHIVQYVHIQLKTVSYQWGNEENIKVFILPGNTELGN